jgi:hypothetical protein
MVTVAGLSVIHSNNICYPKSFTEIVIVSKFRFEQWLIGLEPFPISVLLLWVGNGDIWKPLESCYCVACMES